MSYPNSNILNIIIPQTSASIDPTSTQAPFVERIISGSRLVLQTDTTGTLIGSSDLNVNSITASNISASGYISASNLYVKTNITDAGTLNVVGASTLAGLTGTTATFSGLVSASAGLTASAIQDAGTLTVVGVTTLAGLTGTTATFSGLVSASAGLTASAIQDAGTLTVVGATTLAGLTGTTATFSGLVSASAGLTASAIQDAGTLTVVGNSILSNVFATNITASNISASGFVSASAIFDTGTLTVIGNSTLSNVFATNITASNISASGNISSSNEYIAGTLTVIGNSTLSNVFATNITASNISASGNISASTLRVETSIVDGGTLTVLGSTVLGDTVGDTTRITGSTSISGSLTVVGNTTLQSTFVTNLTASIISASGNISGNDGIFAGDIAVNGGDVTTTLVGTATLFNTNATSVNIGGGAITQVLLGNGSGVVKTAGDFVLGINNAIKDTSGILGLTVSSSLTTVAGDLQVNGNDIKDSTGANNLILSNTKVSVPLTTQATDWSTGALTVAGGVGIGKDAYISGSLNVIGDLTIFGSSSVVYISSSTVIINDNIIQLNAFFPFERYAGFEVFDSGSNQRSASLLWDGQNDNWITVDQNNSSSNVIVGPTASFGTNPGSLLANNIPKAYDATGITTSSLSDDGTTLLYTGTRISASSITASNGSVTNISGTLITYVTGSFTALTVVTGSAPLTGSQVPSSPTAVGMPGQIEVDNNFIYVYTNNIWKRVPLSTWSL